MHWIVVNLGTIVITAGLIFLVVIIVKSMIKKKMAGMNSCSGNCSSCHCMGKCH